jgi:hypothetical protein
MDPIRDYRWPRLATGGAFDPARWAAPDGADRRPVGVEAVEAILHERLAGRERVVVYDARTPLVERRFEILREGGRLRVSSALNRADLACVRSFLDAHREVELELDSAAGESTAAVLLGAERGAVRFRGDVSALLAAVAQPGSLRSLDLVAAGPFSAKLLRRFPALRSLGLRGAVRDLDALRALTVLERLAIADLPTQPLGVLTNMPSLRELRLAHLEGFEPRELAGGSLLALGLRSLPLHSLEWLATSPSLETLELDDLPLVTSVHPIAALAALRRLTIARMPQLSVRDCAPLNDLPALVAVTVDIGGRRKSREVYRALNLGKRTA